MRTWVETLALCVAVGACGGSGSDDGNGDVAGDSTSDGTGASSTGTTGSASSTTSGMSASGADDSSGTSASTGSGGSSGGDTLEGTDAADTGPGLIACDPFGEPCGDGYKCTFDYHPKGGSFACGPLDGDGMQLAPCTSDFTPSDTCADGFTCYPLSPCDGDCCAQLCDLADGDPACADAGLMCLPGGFYPDSIGVCG